MGDTKQDNINQIIERVRSISTKEWVAKEYAIEMDLAYGRNREQAKTDFLSGVQFAQTWLPVDKKSPTKNVSVFVKFHLTREETELDEIGIGVGWLNYKYEWVVEHRYMDDPDYVFKVISWRPETY